MLKVYLYAGKVPDAGALRRSADVGGAVRRAESLAWRQLLACAVRDCGLEADLSRLTVSETGRPFCPGAEFDFSPTHTKGLVAVAVCDSGRVGLDAEALCGRDAGRLLRVTDRWFTGREQARVRAALDAGDGSAEETFLRVWTAKEALVKRNGSGLAGMHAADSCAPGDCLLQTQRRDGWILTVAAPEPLTDLIDCDPMV